MDYIAHTRSTENSSEAQLLSDHLTETAKLAEAFADCFGCGELAYFCGLLHDIGKYSKEFQSRIRYNTKKVDHSTAGAIEAMKAKCGIGAFCIAGHHSGIPNLGNSRSDTEGDATMEGRIKRYKSGGIPDYSAFSEEIIIPDVKTASIPDLYTAFFQAHMLYSCLVDADFLNTEKFVLGKARERAKSDSLEELNKRLKDYTSKWENPISELNKRRCEVLSSCIEGGKEDKGIFTLSVPTGGGKTVSSIAFALSHAVEKKLKRIIYVIPYTSIIEQTQRVYEEIFGKQNVIAHYANVTYQSTDGADVDFRYLATENWDAPIILTTSVQFFESLYGNRSSVCRKLHNIAESVIIFDEAQMLPIKLLRPCVRAICELCSGYGCSAVLCTATQPSFGKLISEFMPKGKDNNGIYSVSELCRSKQAFFAAARRATYLHIGKLSDEGLSAKLCESFQVLCIVNNRKQAQKLYDLIRQSTDCESTYHLSTAMTANDRSETLKIIRERLADGKACRVVSTSVIEAGVDIDFPTVYRAEAGLDSIIQAGGRCNREGKHKADECFVYVFESEQKAPEGMELNISAANTAVRNCGYDSEEAIEKYFNFLYYVIGNAERLDEKEILTDISKGKMNFKDIADRFKLIEGSNCILYIDTAESHGYIEEIKNGIHGKELFRNLGKYSVGVYGSMLKTLVDSGKAIIVTENAAVLTDTEMYKSETGLNLGSVISQGNALFM